MKKHKIHLQNKGDTMSRQLTKLISIYFTLLILVSVSGCSDDDCPTCPVDEVVQPYKGWLYFTEIMYDRYSLYKVDMETDSIVDSVKFPAESGPGMMTVSPDGRYLVAAYNFVFDPSGCQLYDAQTLELLAEPQHPVAPLGFDEDGTLLSVWLEPEVVLGNHLFHFQRLNLPSFSAVSEDTFRDLNPLYVDARHDRIYCAGGRPRGLNTFWAYDYSARTLERIPIRVTAADTIQILNLAIAADGDRLFFLGGGDNGPFDLWLGCWSIKRDSLLWSRQRLTDWGGLALSPDETELWSTDPGIPDGQNPGSIFIHDPVTGGYLGGISLRGYFPSPYGVLTGDWVLFSPTGDRVYVATGLVAFGPPGSVLSVDRRLRKITKLFAPNLDSGPASGAICPKI